jgi:hypothetical protein
MTSAKENRTNDRRDVALNHVNGGAPDRTAAPCSDNRAEGAGDQSVWQVWYVPLAAGGINWRARPFPALNATTPEARVADIGATEEERKKTGVLGE